MNKLRVFWENEKFKPSCLGLFVNPFYFARRGLLKALMPHFADLTGELLDVGCGRKPYRAYISASRYVGIDVDTAVTRALSVADVFYDGKTLPFPDASFDGALCSQVLEHVFTADSFLREIFRVLRPGGVLLLAVPFAWDEHEQPWDFARYSSFGVKALLERNGFVILSQEKTVSDFRAMGQLVSAWIFKTTRTSSRIINLFTQIFLIAPANIATLLISWLLPTNPDFYLDNIILARSKPK